MNSKELVLATLEFRNTDGRVPRQLWNLPWAEFNYPEQLAAIRQAYPDDISGVDGYQKVASQTKGDPHEPGTYVDPWGSTFINIQRGVIGEVKQPLVVEEDWSDADNVHIPEEMLTIDPAKVNQQCAGSDRFIMSGCCPRPFEQLQFLRGTENLYVDLALAEPGLHRFIEKMHDFYCRWVEVWAQTDVDAIMMMDDWGSQRSLLIDPQIWRRVFRPMYEDYIRIAKRYGKKAFMHSDGYTLQIIPDLIEIGLDAFNTQIFCMDFKQLAQYRGSLTFWGEIDRQHLLAKASVAEVKEAVRSADRALWQQGGCIAQCEFGAGAKPENVAAVFETWQELHG